MIFHDMLNGIVSLCRSHPELLIFLSLAIGYYVGKIKFFGFSLGSTASVLLAALVLGQANVQITPLIKLVAFALFIFTIGYRVGPQFFGGLKKEGLNYIFLALFVAIVGLVTAILLGKFFGFDKGTTAGFLAGAMTQSSVIGTAEGAIRGLSVTASQKSLLTSNIAVAYAITYIFGVAGLILFYKIVPKILRINLKDEARKLETPEIKMGSISPDDFAWNVRPNVRMYRVTNHSVIGKTIKYVQDLFEKKVTIEKIKRDNQLLEPKLDTVIKANDVLLLIGSRKQILGYQENIGPEVDDATLADLPMEFLKICVIKKEAVGKSLKEIISMFGKNCFVSRVTRQGHELTLNKDMKIDKCDLLHVIGLKKDMENFVKLVGYPERKTKKTDLVMVGLGCFFGTLLGLAAVKVGYISLTLGVGGGVLLAGLLFGWLRSIHPTFGQVPEGAQWLLSDLGLNLFIACVGLTAGPRAIEALQTHGPTLFFAGVILTLMPHILGIVFGRVFLKLNYALLFGALTGAGTATPSLNVLKNEADSPVPALGYTVPYAIGNFVLTVWGTVIINFM
ncbi:aspartate-alanine antiporter [Candidatus Dependentiae bacterium]